MNALRTAFRRAPRIQFPDPASDVDEMGSLLARCADGEVDAFGIVYSTVASRVYGLMVSIVGPGGASEELTRSVLLEVWDAAGEHGSTIESDEAWIMSRAHLRAVECRRQTVGSRGEAGWPEVVGQLADGGGVLESLGQEDAALLGLIYFGGFTRSEMSARADCEGIDVAQAALRALRSLDVAYR